MSIRQWLGLEPEPVASPETETVRKVVSALNELPPDEARYIAAFGYILGRVANADLKISSEEIAAMERIVAEHGKLPMAQAVVVVQMAKSGTQLFGGTENFLVTREFQRLATREQCLTLVNCLFAVSAAQDGISVTEDNEIRQIVSELGLEHRDFIQVRAAWRDQINVIKNLPEA